MNFDAFSHGQIHSKLWLCEHLEPFIKQDARILAYGSWYNIVGFLLNARKPKFYKEIRGIDIDISTKEIADRINQAWIVDEPNIFNEISDANNYDPAGYDVVINCSCEHFDNMNWFELVENHILLCIQSIDIIDPNEPWLIKQPTRTFNEFMDRYPLRNCLYSGTKRIEYQNGFGYNRFMTIGYK